jgi:O-antigen ligase
MHRIDLAAFAVAAAATVLIAADQGSYFEHSWPWVGIALAATGALALLAPVDVRVGRASGVLIAATVGISLWTLVSWFWSAEPPNTLDEALRSPIYIAAAVTFVVLAGMEGALGLACGVAAGTTGIAAYALLDQALTGGDPQTTLLASPLGYANALGALCAIGLAVVAVLTWQRRRNVLVAAAGAVAAVLLVVALALTSSRGSWAALAAALVVMAAGQRRPFAAAALAAGLAGVSLLTVFTAAPGLLQARGAYWQAAWQVVKRHPFLGSGAGTYDLAWAAYGDITRWDEALDAHSLYVETLAELGVVGFVLVLGLLAPAAWAVVSGHLSPGQNAALAGGLAYLVHAGLDWDWEMPAVTVVGIACLAAAHRPGAAAGPRLRVTLLVLEAAVLLTYVAYLIGHNV